MTEPAAQPVTRNEAPKIKGVAPHGLTRNAMADSWDAVNEAKVMALYTTSTAPVGSTSYSGADLFTAR